MRFGVWVIPKFMSVFEDDAEQNMHGFGTKRSATMSDAAEYQGRAQEARSLMDRAASLEEQALNHRSGAATADGNVVHGADRYVQVPLEIQTGCRSCGNALVSGYSWG